MKKIILMSLLGLTFLAGCSNREPQTTVVEPTEVVVEEVETEPETEVESEPEQTPIEEVSTYDITLEVLGKKASDVQYPLSTVLLPTSDDGESWVEPVSVQSVGLEYEGEFGDALFVDVVNPTNTWMNVKDVVICRDTWSMSSLENHLGYTGDYTAEEVNAHLVSLWDAPVNTVTFEGGYYEVYNVTEDVVAVVIYALSYDDTFKFEELWLVAKSHANLFMDTTGLDVQNTVSMNSLSTPETQYVNMHLPVVNNEVTFRYLNRVYNLNYTSDLLYCVTPPFSVDDTGLANITNTTFELASLDHVHSFEFLSRNSNKQEPTYTGVLSDGTEYLVFEDSDVWDIIVGDISVRISDPAPDVDVEAFKLEVDKLANWLHGNVSYVNV